MTILQNQIDIIQETRNTYQENLAETLDHNLPIQVEELEYYLEFFNMLDKLIDDLKHKLEVFGEVEL